MKRYLACFLAAVLCLSLCACGRQEKEQVRQVEELIRAIGEVDAESGPRIEAAEQAYNALEEKQRQQVGGAFYLPLARRELEKLLAEQAEQKAADEERAARQSYELSVQGDWDEAEDILEQIAENVDMLVGYLYEEADIPFADFVESMEIHATLRLRPNHTYSVFLAGEDLEVTLAGMREGLMHYLEHLYRYALWKEYWDKGYRIDDPYDDDAWRRKMGAAFGEITPGFSGMSLEEELSLSADEIIGSIYNLLAYTELAGGNYQVEAGKLFLSDSLDDAIKDDSYLTFELGDDTLTLTGQHDSDALTTEFPVTLARKNTAPAA